MALSSYYRQYDAQNLDALNQQKEIINQTADSSIKMIEDAGSAQIKEAEHAYDGVINTANVQKLINERAVAERMSNMGLTDSGLNRTQQTAIELSRSNAINNAMIARQKQVDAIALAVRQQVGQLNIQRNNDIMNADLTYNANKNSWASSMYDADQQAAAARYKAQLDYDAKMTQMYLDSEKETNKKNEEKEKERTKARGTLIEKLFSDDFTDDEKRGLIESYRQTYGQDAGITDIAVNLGISTVGQVNPEENKTWNNSDIKKGLFFSGATEYGDPYDENAAKYKRAEGESDYNFAQRVADESFLTTPIGQKVVSTFGEPNPNLSAEGKRKLEDEIYNFVVALGLRKDRAEAYIETLYRIYYVV